MIFAAAVLALRTASTYSGITDAGWSSSVARWAHNPEVTGSNPVPATTKGPVIQVTGRFLHVHAVRCVVHHRVDYLGSRSPLTVTAGGRSVAVHTAAGPSGP